MKKIFKLLIAIFLIVLIFEVIAYIIKDNHETSYKIKVNDTKYNIEEIYKNKKYYLKISNKDYKYLFETEDNFHKKKKILSKIYEYKTGDALCIYPVLKKDTDLNIMCSKNNNSYSYTYYKDKLKDFVKELKEKGYKHSSWKEESNYQIKLDTLNIYKKNINENTFIYIYKYNGFYSINSKENKKIDLFKNDNYNNTLGFILDKYYIVPNYDEKYDYDDFYIIDMTTNKVKQKKYKIAISKDSYINGNIDDEVYIFDKDELKQYKIYKKGKKIKEVGNKEDGALMYDLKFKRINAYNMRDKDMKFKTIENYLKEVEQNTSLKYIRGNIDTYYYQTSNNDVYYYNTNNKQKVLLFNKEISDFILIDDTIYFISKDTLYSYSNNEGLKNLLVYKELAFNPNNRLAIYKK